MPEKRQWRPLRRTDLTLQTVGSEALVYERQTGAVGVLNPTARLIWELCDGQHTLEQIVEAVQTSFTDTGQYDVAGQTVALIQSLAAQNWIVFEKSRA